jgi:catechol 2,3-dioxygenase-like lactoylglutathione lyase family enzyme
VGRVVQLMHHAIRIGTSDEDLKAAERFYGDILGLELDPNRPYVPGIPGFWYNVGPNQIHLMGSPRDEPRVIFPEGKPNDPTVPHVALTVDSLEDMRRRFREEGITYWEVSALTGVPQLFVRDPFGNQIELQEQRG